MQTINSFKLFIIGLVVCSNVFSQTNVYRPFPQGYGFWSMTRQSMSGLNYYRYKTSGDTLVGTYTYKKVLYAYNVTPGPFNFSPYAFKFAYRNDSINKKVYYLDVTGGLNKDTLWYDFNLNIGDSVENTYSYMKNGFFNDRVVQSIDSVLICGSYHKRFKFNCTDYEADLVEGVGFLDNFIHSERTGDCPFEPTYIYSTSFSSCNITSVEDYLKGSTIKIFPNPTSSELRISGLSKITEYAIINNIGATILKGNLSDSQSIDVSSLADGMYILNIQDRSAKLYQSKFIKQ